MSCRSFELVTADDTICLSVYPLGGRIKRYLCYTATFISQHTRGLDRNLDNTNRSEQIDSPTGGWSRHVGVYGVPIVSNRSSVLFLGECYVRRNLLGRKNAVLARVLRWKEERFVIHIFFYKLLVSSYIACTELGLIR